jgi:serine/threonine-protein kinase
MATVVDSTMTPSLPDTGGVEAELQAGQVVGEYQVELKIGQGGFGAVFKAVHPLIGKQVAIKVLSQRFSVDPQMVSRFLAEARAVNQIRHHNIIDIFSFGTLEDGRLYYVMEYLDGEPLDKRLSRRGRMSLADAIPILRAIARALDAAHAKGIAHRDLKAENVFLAAHPDGVYPKLLDFGIAKLMAPEDGLSHKTRTGAPMGTPHYMSPEQCRGRDVDHRTDMYAFGVLAYLMLTGVYPLDGDDYMAILMRQIHDDPLPPSSHRPELPVGVNAAIAWLMRKVPASRPETLMDAVRMLERVAGGEALTVPPPRESLDGLSTLPVEPGEAAPGIPPAVPLGGGAAQPSIPPASAAIAVAQPTPSPAPSANQAPEALPAAAEARRWPASHVLLAGGALLAAAAIVAVMVIRSSGRDDPAPGDLETRAGGEAAAGGSAGAAAAPDAAAPAADAAAAAPDAAAPAPPSVRAEVVVTIDGSPPGTEVRRAGVLLGTAPGPVLVRREEAEVMLVLSADGYVPETIAVVPSKDLTRTVKLKPKAAAVRPAPRGGGAARPGGGSAKGSGAGPGPGGDEPTNDIEQFPPVKPTAPRTP